MSELIAVHTWGRSGIGTIAVRPREDETTRDAAVRSIERRTGLQCCGGPCPQGTALSSRGRPESDHYSMALGRPARGGGWNVEGEIWFAVPVVVAVNATSVRECADSRCSYGQHDQVPDHRWITVSE